MAVLNRKSPVLPILLYPLGMIAFVLLGAFLLQDVILRENFTIIVIPVCIFLLPNILLLFAQRELHTYIAGRAPSLVRYDRSTGFHINKHAVYSLLEDYVYLAATIGLIFGVVTFLKPPYLLVSIIYFLCATTYFAIRLNYRLQPARDERAALERQAAALRDAPPTLASLINEKLVVIGTPMTRDAVPIYYREDPEQEERFRHTYIIGASGYGKTTCLCDLVAQDIFHGNGVIVLSAEDDLFPKLLSYIPKYRMDDLIYFDPADTTSPIIGFNPFTHKAGNLDQQTGETITIVTRAMGHELGVTMKPIIDNAVAVLVRRPGATFADLMKLINPANKTLRASLKTDSTIDEEARDFWKQYDETTYYRKSYESIQARFSPFARSPISTVLATSSFSFKDAMRDSRIIFLDLSQIRDTAVTMGQLLLASIEQSLLTRNPLDASPYYLYIDEFQLYAADSKDTLIKIFNGARKRKFGVNVAHQTTANIPTELMKTITQSASTKIVMHLSADDAPFFARQLQLRRADREAAAPELLQNLKVGQAYVQSPTHSVGVPVTIPAKPVTPLPTPVPDLKARSKENFGTEPSVPPSIPSTDHVTDQPDPPKPPVPQKKKSFGITFE